MINILNLIVILVYIGTILKLYDVAPDFFSMLLLPISLCVQLLISSAYIETGVYLIDMGVRSYGSGATFRFFILYEIQLLVFVILGKKYQNKLNSLKSAQGNISFVRLWNIITLIVAGYVLLDILFSGNILTNGAVTRFNYYSNYSKLPFAQLLSYFLYPLAFVQGHLFINGTDKKQKIYSICYLVSVLLGSYLRGVQFGGFFIIIIYFAMPLVMPLARKHKLINFKYIILATGLIVVMMIPKYNYMATTKMYDSLGLKSAYDVLMYRALGQGADITWVLDKQITEYGYIDPAQAKNEIQGLFSGKAEGNGADYLMRRACPKDIYTRYKLGGAGISGGYPIIWAAIFGYIGAVIPVITDALVFFWLVYKILKMMKHNMYIRLFMAVFIYNMCYSIIGASGLYYLGNIIPQAFFALIVLTDLLIGKKIVRINK